jgi:hypothetical protein
MLDARDIVNKDIVHNDVPHVCGKRFARNTRDVVSICHESLQSILCF